MKGGEKTKKILENIGDFAGEAGDFIEVFLSMPYGSSIKSFRRARDKKRRVREEYRALLEKERLEIQKWQNLISKLKRDGCILYETKNNKKSWNLTLRGAEKLAKLQKQLSKGILPSITYLKEGGAQIIIVSFDIPERERRKRDWLRAVLYFLGFKMLQKSVWIGKIKIPEKLLEDIKDLRIIDFVEIFSINKSGSLRQII